MHWESEHTRIADVAGVSGAARWGEEGGVAFG